MEIHIAFHLYAPVYSQNTYIVYIYKAFHLYNSEFSRNTYIECVAVHLIQNTHIVYTYIYIYINLYIYSFSPV